MSRYTFRVRLCVDAELGSGLGGELVNDFVPRDIDGFPVLAATHIRGLMRQSLLDIALERRADWSDHFSDANDRPWPAPLIERVFGAFDSRGAKVKQQLRLEDAVMTNPDREVLRSQIQAAESLEWAPTHFVTRTKIDEIGRAEEASLRTTEAISRDVEFTGCIFSDFQPGSIEDLAWRLALTTISAIGGSRNRGGQCLVELFDNDAPSISPGTLLGKLDAAIKAKQFHVGKRLLPAAGAEVANGEATLVELIFVADSPVCCPERPDKSNVIVSGFSIPASAVQGLLLNHVNSLNAAFADQMFGATSFRCWPLQPICVRNDQRLQRAIRNDDLDFDALPTAIRVSLSHRIAKFSMNIFGREHFLDLAFERWQDAPDGAPLKAVDGVLLSGDILDEQPLLWRAAEMPHYISSHGVTNGPKERSEEGSSRNLFSVDAMAPIVWRGLVSVPASLSKFLVESVNQTRQFSVGKRKSVRGSGRLWARQVEVCHSESKHSHAKDVLVLQSPTPIPLLSAASHDADDLLLETARAWCEFHHLPTPHGAWADIGIQFGWNNSQSDPFQEAIKVFLPGSTIALGEKADPKQLQAAMLEGFRRNPHELDQHRTRGFGAIASHPGKAVGLYSGSSTVRQIRAAEPGLKAAVDSILQLNNLPYLPSSSQIRSLVAMLSDDPASLVKANEFLSRRLDSSYKIWADWEQVQDTISQILTNSTPSVAHRALKALADIATAREKENA